jgi:hypothetical protein
VQGRRPGEEREHEEERVEGLPRAMYPASLADSSDSDHQELPRHHPEPDGHHEGVKQRREVANATDPTAAIGSVLGSRR